MNEWGDKTNDIDKIGEEHRIVTETGWLTASNTNTIKHFYKIIQ